MKLIILSITYVFIVYNSGYSQPQVETYGSLRKIMHENDTSEKVRLNLIGPLLNYYGLGAAAGLDGEILILDGETYVTRTWNGSLTTDKSTDVGVALLVMTQVLEWDTLTINAGLSSIKELEDYIAQFQNSQNGPFPFVILSDQSSIRWHVIRRPQNKQEMKNHRELGRKGKYSGSALILGFYSDSRRGVFTHQGQNTHLHFQSQDKLYAGHVDELVINKGDILLIPK